MGMTSRPEESCVPCPLPGVLPAKVPGILPGRWQCVVMFFASDH